MGQSGAKAEKAPAGGSGEWSRRWLPDPGPSAVARPVNKAPAFGAVIAVPRSGSPQRERLRRATPEPPSPARADPSLDRRALLRIGATSKRSLLMIIRSLNSPNISASAVRADSSASSTMPIGTARRAPLDACWPPSSSRPKSRPSLSRFRGPAGCAEARRLANDRARSPTYEQIRPNRALIRFAGNVSRCAPCASNSSMHDDLNLRALAVELRRLMTRVQRWAQISHQHIFRF